MKVNAPGEAHVQRVLGKEFLIVIVVFSSALSFSLGLLVGRSGREARPETAGSPSAQSHVVNVQPEQTGGPGPRTEQKQEVPVAADRQPAAPGEGGAAGGQAPSQRAEGKTTIPGKDSRNEDTPRVSAEAGEVFVVQLGALRSPAEARRLKDRMAKKGYKTAIVSAKGKNGEKIYKIRTGEFRDRKEAEALALKLKKTEGLNTFVTPRHE